MAQSASRGFDVTFGVSLALLLSYLHLPQFLCEALFLRCVQVLEYNYDHLMGHLKCCLSHGINMKVQEREKPEQNCCLRHCNNLLKLFCTINDTFKGQLLIQFALILGTLIFGKLLLNKKKIGKIIPWDLGIYLSITFLVGKSVPSHGLFTLGFCLYSFVPAIRLWVVAAFVDRSMDQMTKTRHALYEAEAQAVIDKDLELAARMRSTIQKYMEVKGFSASNYFLVNRPLVSSILGYLSTYIIVLVQFKIADIQD